MSPTDIHLIAETLPLDILSRIDEQFYSCVKGILGKSFSDLLEVAQINSATSFLMSDNFLDILQMDIDHQPLIELKKAICFRLTDGSTVVKPGIMAGFKCFKEALVTKREMVMKQIKRAKRPAYTTTTNEQSPPPLASTTPTPMATSSQSSSPEASFSNSLAFHKEFIIQSVNRWCEENKSLLGFSDRNLADAGADFTSRFTWNDQHEINCDIACRCGITIKLTSKDDRFQLSNFYKHLRQTNCTHLSRLKELQQKQSSNASTHRTSATPSAIGTSSSITINHDANGTRMVQPMDNSSGSADRSTDSNKTKRRSFTSYPQRQKRVRT